MQSTGQTDKQASQPVHMSSSSRASTFGSFFLAFGAPDCRQSGQGGKRYPYGRISAILGVGIRANFAPCVSLRFRHSFGTSMQVGLFILIAVVVIALIAWQAKRSAERERARRAAL